MVYTLIGGSRFEWDPEKAARNLGIHGVSFRDAAWVFGDPDAVYALDPEHSVEEIREKALGLSWALGVVVVVFTERRGGVFRIISARKATRRERAEYEKIRAVG